VLWVRYPTWSPKTRPRARFEASTIASRVLSETVRAVAEATADYQRLLEVVARKLAGVVKDGCVV
jgi:hypothetical protein